MGTFGARLTEIKNGPKFVSYLEATGTQFLELGFAPNQNTEFEITVEYDNLVGNGWFFGSGKTWANGAFYAGVIAISFGSFARTTTHVTKGKPVVVTFKDRVLAHDGVAIVTATSNTFQADANAFLFGVDCTTAADELFVGRVYSFKLYDNKVLIRDMLPCYDPKGVACMFDQVEQKYYYNAGSGEFTAG